MEPTTANDPMIDPNNDEESTPLTVLDATRYQLKDLDSIDLPPTLIEIDLMDNQLTKLDPRISHLSKLRRLSLRQNCFDDSGVDPISQWNTLSGLEELHLPFNQLTKIPDVSIFKALLVFDVSFNEISSMVGLSKVSNTLKQLHICKTQVTKIEEIEHLCELRKIEFSSNKLRVMENLHNLTNLQELWLGRNRIRAINLCGLKLIKNLSLQSNRLTSMKGLEECTALERLYLAHNGITKMEGLSTLANLHFLDVSSNKLAAVEDIEKLTCLKDLWFNDNQIASLRHIAGAISGSREKLATIHLENNPCAKSSDYFTTLRQIFPNIEQIDSKVFA